jgi:transcriptional regulator
MGKSSNPTLLQGTLDLLILHALQRGAMHGYAIAQTIHLLSDEVLKVEEGSLYPALHRLELSGLLCAEWGLSENKRRARFYQLTAKGRRRLEDERESWQRVAAAIARVMDTA